MLEFYFCNEISSWVFGERNFVLKKLHHVEIRNLLKINIPFNKLYVAQSVKPFSDQEGQQPAEPYVLQDHASAIWEKTVVLLLFF